MDCPHTTRSDSRDPRRCSQCLRAKPSPRVPIEIPRIAYGVLVKFVGVGAGADEEVNDG